MNEKNDALSETDRKILEAYATAVDGLAAFLGDAFEIILYDITDFEHAVVHIANGFHSGRKKGAPITEVARDMLEKIRENMGMTGKQSARGETAHDAGSGMPQVPWVTFVAANRFGKPVKSTVIALFGEKTIIGLLCVNFYMDSPVASLAPLVGGLAEIAPEFHDEKLRSSSDHLIMTALEKVRTEVESDGTIPAYLKKKEMVHRLFYQGIFKLKNSVLTIARSLGVSKNTIYLHLRKLEKK